MRRVSLCISVQLFVGYLCLIAFFGCSSGPATADGCQTDADCVDKGDGYVCDSDSGLCVSNDSDGDTSDPDGDDSGDGDRDDPDGDQDSDGDVDDPDGDRDIVGGDPRLTVDPRLDISAEIGVQQTADIQLSNAGDGRLEITSVTLENADPGFELLYLPAFPLGISPQTTSDITVAYTAENSQEAEATVVIVSNDPLLPSVSVSVLAAEVGYPTIVVSPLQANFGTVATLEGEESVTLSIQNYPTDRDTTAALIIDDAAFDPPDTPHFSLADAFEPMAVIPFGEQILDIVCHPQEDGEQTAELLLSHNDPAAANPLRLFMRCIGGQIKLDVQPEEVDFGSVTVGSQEAARVTLTNIGNLSVELYSISLKTGAHSSLSIVSAPVAGTIVSVASSKEILLAYKPTLTGVHSAVLVVESNDITQPLREIPLTGKGIVSRLQVSPAQHNFGSVMVGQQEELSVQLANIGEASITVSGIDNQNGNGDYSWAQQPFPTDLAVGDTLDLLLRYQPGSAARDDEVFLFDIGEAGDIPSLTIFAQGARPEIRLSMLDGSAFTGNINFGIVRAGERAEVGMYIRNNGNFPLIIDEVALNDTASPFIFTEPEVFPEVPGGGQVILTFVFEPDASASQEYALATILSNDPTYNAISIALAGTAVAPRAEVLPETSAEAPLDVGAVALDAEWGPEILTLDNVGVGTLSVDALSFSAESSPAWRLGSSTLPLPGDLPASGDPVEVEVFFKPETAGTHDAVLRFETDDYLSPVHAVYLTGDGFACADGTWNADDNPRDCEYDCVLQNGGQELCNGQDDDCDNQIDEDFGLDGVCNPGGICPVGVWECNPLDANGVICSTGAGGSADASQPESCNGLDDDCDGLTDHGEDLCAPRDHADAYCVARECVYVCKDTYHACGDVCSPDDEVATCGSRCTPCSEPAHAVASCEFSGSVFYCSFTCEDPYVRLNDQCVIPGEPDDCGPAHLNCLAGGTPAHSEWVCVNDGGAYACALTCDPGYHLDDLEEACVTNESGQCCGLDCIVCPAPEHAEADCVGGVCVYDCLTGYHECSGACVDDTSVLSCGSNCSPCPSPENAEAICNAGQCDFVCAADYHDCNGNCVNDDNVNHCGDLCTPCPGVANAQTTCESGQCGFSCNSTFHACDDQCVSNYGVDHCGSSCTPCEAPEHATAACINQACTFFCVSGFHRCGDVCVSNYETDTCGDSCTPCAPREHAVMDCNGVSCTYSCFENYHECGDACVSDSAVETCGDNCAPCPEKAGMDVDCDGVSCVYTCSDGYYDLDDDLQNGCEYACSFISADDEPDLEGIDSNCDGVDGRVEALIFVSVNYGFAGAPGTWQQPMDSIEDGLAAANAANPKKSLIVSQGTYTEIFTLPSGVSMYGGYDDSYSEPGWSRPPEAETSLFGNINYGTTIENISTPTLIQKFTFYNQVSALSVGMSSYGLVIKNCSADLVIEYCEIVAQSASDGEDGSDGTDAVACWDFNGNGLCDPTEDLYPFNGPDGQCNVNDCAGRPGENGSADSADGGYGGTSGLSACSQNGHNGGRGGYSSTYTGTDNGDSGLGPLGGGGGHSNHYSGYPGGNGTNGTNGANGVGALGGGYFDAFDYWQAQDGTDGGEASVGTGGSGGGGGFGDVGRDRGAGGGGGGGGGCFGTPGTGGTGGGAAFGVYLIDSSPTIRHCSIVVGDGGHGGAGGHGGDGTAGGPGGNGGSGRDGSGDGGHGGAGGQGGTAGSGGGGGGGDVAGIARLGNSVPTLTDNTIELGTAGSGGAGEDGNSGADGVQGEALIYSLP